MATARTRSAAATARTTCCRCPSGRSCASASGAASARPSSAASSCRSSATSSLDGTLRCGFCFEKAVDTFDFSGNYMAFYMFFLYLNQVERLKTWRVPLFHEVPAPSRHLHRGQRWHRRHRPQVLQERRQSKRHAGAKEPRHELFIVFFMVLSPRSIDFALILRVVTALGPVSSSSCGS